MPESAPATSKRQRNCKSSKNETNAGDGSNESHLDNRTDPRGLNLFVPQLRPERIVVLVNADGIEEAIEEILRRNAPAPTYEEAEERLQERLRELARNQENGSRSCAPEFSS